ncbi:MAG: TspO protein [Candidatus Magasanikbacteria bacterium RIFCSPHIGHO2_01_FULL_33_34]|uniref:TspO protein n=1 Tax=Candidatus Magasanikbacteria bacterium RIFCSPHIGHO2_01_FULL_33_34 TaxID=1798671 RepID=A0A1F6LIV4_9BACT|nr:MAG: TspO protein [Candidatus Magasanikbacteria bacterium RIFCSPHIGHO2_01_FULL_33_34]OGH65286.1 MAG: TspO protein [Candidatus Magasanikbacteria bacterium RIFCSPHIGHO2_02_FULL_33_17]OGH76063.1 MAG: TspO protein [Candidatus Magasanikbacteria bacterium RIFCSPLOWO2_01_FULL_33_34]OGH81766.1 MAG: TspO protein [Candidatus Magasanikbacteria bacterium RIFCSPLOWO2_12_FULL_34_7]
MNYKRLSISLILPQLTGIIGSFFTVSAIPTWYTTLVKPSFSPPNWLFGPVWVTLYFLMGISIYLIWQKVGKTKDFWLFWTHLFFNAIWTMVFFGLRNPGLALINIVILLCLIVVLIIRFWKIKKTSAYLLMPYLLWVTFATVLNYSLWYLN